MINSKQVRKGVRLFFATFWLIAFLGVAYSMQARGFDPSVLESDSEVHVHATDEQISFQPVADTASVGLIFYPGALVDPDAYAPLARAVAEAGYRVTMIRVPFRMDLFDWQWKDVIARTEAVLSTESTAAA